MCQPGWSLYLPLARQQSWSLIWRELVHSDLADKDEKDEIPKLRNMAMGEVGIDTAMVVVVALLAR